MKIAILIVRTLLGLAFFVLGLDHFLHFMEKPTPELPTAALNFASALGSTGYMDVVKAIELAGGLFLLTGLFAPLGLVLLTPVLVNIVLFDLLMMKKPGLGLVLLGMAIFLIWGYRSYFAPLFTARAKTSSCCQG